jgi:CubicO group peptidase (beta-lactamase class C family)
MLQKLILSFGSALLLIGCSEATRKPDSAELDTLLGAAVESRQVPAVVAMVASREGRLYQGAVGLPIDAIFAIASMTKAVTSVAVMQLIEAGKVRLDEPVHTYLPELRALQVLDGGALRPPKSSPTVRHLLTHTSGFAYEFLNREIAEQVQSGKLASLDAGTDEFLRAPLVIDPGVRWEYGISTDWLGRLVETVTGQSLDAYFRSNVFEPLAMTETFFDVPSDKEARVALRYARQPNNSLAALPREPLRPVKFFSGGGGLYSTAADYLRFAQALLAGGELDGRRVLRTDTVLMMGQNQIGELTLPPVTTQNPQLVAPNTVQPGGLDAFGLGFALNRKPLASGRGAGTMSWAGVYNTFFWVDHEKGVCAVVLVQMLPFGDPGPIRLVEDFDRAVYRAYRGPLS